MGQTGDSTDEEFVECNEANKKMAQHFSIDPPSAFDFHTPSEWTKWSRRFERFRIASGLTSKSEEEPVNMLIYTMGEKADDIFSSFKLTESNSKSYKHVLEKFTEHFIPKVNVIYERSRFNLRVQEQGKNVEEFVTALHKMAENCDFAKYVDGLQDELIRDRLVVGLLDKKLNQNLQLEDNLTLQRAIQVARQSEDIKNQTEPQTVDRVQFKREQAKKAFVKLTHAKTPGNIDSREFQCIWCGEKRFHSRNQCPALKAKCAKYSRIGHFTKVCLSKSVNAVSATPSEDDDKSTVTDDTFFIGGVDNTHNEMSWTRGIQINSGEAVKFKIDTGADVNVIPPELATSFILRPKLYYPDRTKRTLTF